MAVLIDNAAPAVTAEVSPLGARSSALVAHLLDDARAAIYSHCVELPIASSRHHAATMRLLVREVHASPRVAASHPFASAHRSST